MMPPFATKKPPARHLFKGTWFSVAEIAAATGMSVRTIQRRLENGIALDLPRRTPGPKRKRYEFRGCSLTIKEIAALTGWSVTKTRTRVSGNRVLEGEDMHMTDLLKDNLVLLTFKGRTDTVAAWSQRLGITDATLRNRINRGWSIERALTEPPMRPNERFVFKHNRRVIRRIAASFRSSSKTGGSPQTFQSSTGTGGGRHETDLEGKSE